jgi:curved DNA-binding protein CbpA
MTHYEIVSIDPTATREQLKKARRDAAQLHHPDRLQQMPEPVRALAEAHFKRINAAYDVLSDPALSHRSCLT